MRENVFASCTKDPRTGFARVEKWVLYVDGVRGAGGGGLDFLGDQIARVDVR